MQIGEPLNRMIEIESRQFRVDDPDEWQSGWETASDDLIGEPTEKVVRVARFYMDQLLAIKNSGTQMIPFTLDWVRGYCDAVIWVLEEEGL